MFIPRFTIDGVLPPFQGADPGGDPALMSPYIVTAVDVVDRFGATDVRRTILKGWLEHRTALRVAGIVGDFQLLDGSIFGLLQTLGRPQTAARTESTLPWSNGADY